MTREDGIRQIVETPWAHGDEGELNLTVEDAYGHPVHAWLQPRPVYCDRGHIQLNIDMLGEYGEPALDRHDSFPRYFFSFPEADAHTRTFLKWRLWRERTHPHASIQSAFEG